MNCKFYKPGEPTKGYTIDRLNDEKATSIRDISNLLNREDIRLISALSGYAYVYVYTEDSTYIFDFTERGAMFENAIDVLN